MKPTDTKSHVLQVSLEGLDLDKTHLARIENAMRTAVLGEVARLELDHGVVFEPIGKGRIFDGHIINGIILRHLRRQLEQLQPR